MAENGPEATATAVAWFETDSVEFHAPLRALHSMVHAPLSYVIDEGGCQAPVQRVWRRSPLRGLRLRVLNVALRFTVAALLLPLVLISKAMIRSYER